MGLELVEVKPTPTTWNSKIKDRSKSSRKLQVSNLNKILKMPLSLESIEMLPVKKLLEKCRFQN